MNVQQLPRLTKAIALVGAPVCFLASGLAVTALTTSNTRQVALIAADPGRWYLFTLFTLVGSMLLVPALLALLDLGRERAPRASILGAGLALLGALVATADSATQLVYWQMGARSADAAQMSALVHRYESAPGSAVIFTVGGLAFMVGGVLLGVGLWRARALPMWAAAALPLGIVTNVAAFTSSSRGVLIGSSAILLAGFAPAVTRVLGETRSAAGATSAVALPGAP
jgi:hypothetical protein